MKALSVQQPWASLIVMGIKTIENRVWSTAYRGPLVIHASRTHDNDAGVSPDDFDLKNGVPLEYGALIGVVDLVDIVTEHPSEFFIGPYGWVLANARHIEPIPMRGQLRLFDVDITPHPN